MFERKGMYAKINTFFERQGYQPNRKH